MAIAAAAAAPTGIDPRDLAGLSTVELQALETWHRDHAGADGGRPWWPAGIRTLPIARRLELALDDQAAADWREAQRRAVARSPVYLTRWFGHLQPPTGPPIPFAMWTEQEETLIAFWHRRRTIVLKARQLGLTWLALHYAYWLLAYNPDTPNARILALSKHGGDASKLLERARKIRELLPPFLRHQEAADTRGSKSELELEGRGKMVSLPGTPEAARMETATLALEDEAAFIRNGQAAETATAVDSTIGDTGQEITLSTGNGKVGNGAWFADEWAKAKRGESERHPIFLPAGVDPARTDEWRERRVANYPSPEKFAQEHPETEAQAFAGSGTITIYPSEHLDAAYAIGRALAELEQGRFYRELAAAGLDLGIDWGDTQTFATWGAELPDHGIYIMDELAMAETEPAAAAGRILDHEIPDLEQTRIAFSAADLSPPGTNRTYATVLRQRHDADPGRYPHQHVKVPFGVYKEGGTAQGTGGVNTVGFLRNRLAAAYRFHQRPDWRARVHEARGLLAIHPRCKTLRPQMEDLERDPQTGKVKKPELDPHDLTKGDHGPDSLVAMNHRRATAWSATIPETDG